MSQDSYSFTYFWSIWSIIMWKGWPKLYGKYLILFSLYCCNLFLFCKYWSMWFGAYTFTLCYAVPICSVMSRSLWSHGLYVGCQTPLSMGIFQARILEQFAVPPGDLQNPGIEPRSPALQVDSLPSELPGKPIRPSNSVPRNIFQRIENTWPHKKLYCTWMFIVALVIIAKMK